MSVYSIGWGQISILGPSFSCRADRRKSFHFSSLRSLDRLRRRGVVTGDLTKILFQSYLQEAILSSSGMGENAYSLMLSIQHFLCRPRRRPPSKVPWRTVMERLLLRVICPNHASLRLVTIARKCSCGSTRKLILLRTQLLVLCSSRRRGEVSSGTWFRKPGSFFQSQ